MFAARIPFFSKDFMAYQFQQNLTFALQKAQMAQLYTQQDVLMDVVDNVLVFRLSDEPEYYWEVNMPEHGRFNPDDFPITLGAKQLDIRWITESQTFNLEPGYVLKKSP